MNCNLNSQNSICYYNPYNKYPIYRNPCTGEPNNVLMLEECPCPCIDYSNHVSIAPYFSWVGGGMQSGGAAIPRMGSNHVSIAPFFSWVGGNMQSGGVAIPRM